MNEFKEKSSTTKFKSVIIIRLVFFLIFSIGKNQEKSGKISCTKSEKNFNFIDNQAEEQKSRKNSFQFEKKIVKKSINQSNKNNKINQIIN